MDSARIMLRTRLQETIRLQSETMARNEAIILRMARDITTALKKKKKVVLFGNGGSAADSQHMAAELIGRFQKERRALAAVALTVDTSILTALSNDYGFNIVFARQLEGIGCRGDIAIGFSTSGNSQNVIQAFKKAKTMGIKTLSLTGCGGGKLARISDIALIVPSKNTARVQEVHGIVAHLLCELVERNFSK